MIIKNTSFAKGHYLAKSISFMFDVKFLKRIVNFALKKLLAVMDINPL